MNLDVTAIVLQTGLLLLLAPLVSGVVRKGKARLQNRRGPPVWQPYLDLHKFLRKDMVISEHASWVFSFALKAKTIFCNFIASLLGGWSGILESAYPRKK